MVQHNVTTSGTHLANALVSPTGGGTDITLADLAALAQASAGAANSLVVDTIAAMMAVTTPTANQMVTVRGYSSVDDSGGGVFMWTAASTATANSGTIFSKASGGTGRWIRQFSGSGDIRWFGARSGQPATTAITLALQAMYAGAFGVLIIPPGTWPINAVITQNVRANTGIIADGATFVPSAGVMGTINLNGVTSSIGTTVTSTPTRGGMTVTLANMTGVAIGDLINIKGDRDAFADNNIAPSHEKLQETQTIREVEAGESKIWLDAPFIFTITPFAVGAVLTASIQKITRDFFWRGGTFDFQEIAETGITFTGFSHLHIQDANFINSQRNHLRIISCAYDKTINCHFVEAGMMSEHDQTYTNIGGLSFGYGIIHTNSCYSSVMNCTAGSGWHSFEAAAGTRDIRYISCAANSNAYSFNQHAGVGRVTLDNCTSEGKYGVKGGAVELFINGGLFRGRCLAIGTCRMMITRVVGAHYQETDDWLVYISDVQADIPDTVVEFIGCTFNSGTALISSGTVKHVLFKDCTQINSSFQITGQQIYIQNCTSVSNVGTEFILFVSSRPGLPGTAYIDNYVVTNDIAINNVIRGHDNMTIFINNSTFDFPRIGGSSHMFYASAISTENFWYIQNCMFRQAANMGVYNMRIKLLKNCLFMTGTANTPTSGATIENQIDNVYMAIL